MEVKPAQNYLLPPVAVAFVEFDAFLDLVVLAGHLHGKGHSLFGRRAPGRRALRRARGLEVRAIGLAADAAGGDGPLEDPDDGARLRLLRVVRGPR